MRIIIIKELGVNSYVLENIKRNATELGYTFLELNKTSDLHSNDIAEKAIISITIKEGSLLRRKFWYNVRLPLLLKKSKATVVIYNNGCCSLNLNQIQWLILPEYGYLKGSKKGLNAWQQYSRRQFRFFADKTSRVITYSNVAKQFLMENYDTNPEKIAVIYPRPAPECKALDFDNKAAILENYTDEKNYFIVTDYESADDLIEIMKAFSKFKKWQQSGMKLVILASKTDLDASFSEKMDSYKYRGDVKFIYETAVDQRARLLASAYAFVHFTGRDENVLPVLNAMQSEVPVISTRLKTIEEICGDAAIYFDDKDVADLSKQMIRLYKEEQFCTQLVEKGKLQMIKLLEHNKKNPVWQWLTD